MLKVSSILTDTAMQSLSPLADCSVNDMLVKVVLFIAEHLSEVAILLSGNIFQNTGLMSLQ